ncbi:MAG: hypothetical protein ACMUIS_09405 [bacterium]
MCRIRFVLLCIIILTIFMVMSITFRSMAGADTWAPLPPYNVLWPLWSPALSPIDPTTGVPIPLVGSLNASTVLPVQPGLVWNPAISYPYLLFNVPGGLAYYDPLFGINSWPPDYMLDPVTGNPLPIDLPLGWNLLPPTDPLWLNSNVPIANLAYIGAYQGYALQALSYGLPVNLSGLDPWLVSLTYPTPAFSSLLTPAAILGY